jgi:hypothetical protein
MPSAEGTSTGTTPQQTLYTEQQVLQHVQEEVAKALLNFQQDQQIPTPTPAPVPITNLEPTPTINPTHAKKNHMAKPDYFDGNPSKYRKFIIQTKIYITANIQDFPLQQDQVMFFISLMNDGLAAQWVENLAMEAEEFDDFPVFDEKGKRVKDVDGENVTVYRKMGFPNMDEFMERLNGTFGNSNIMKENQTKLSELKQGQKTAEEFFQLFDEYRRAAGYQKNHDLYLIELLEKALNHYVLQAIYAGGLIPNTYQGYRDRAILNDGLQRRLRSIKASTPSTAKVAPPPKTTFTSQSTPPKPRDPNGPQPMVIDGLVHFGGRRTPLSIDEARQQRLCFNCG